jgi:hypothetical protein
MSTYATPQRRFRKPFDRLAAPMAPAKDAASDTPLPEAIPPAPAPRDRSLTRRPLAPLPLFRPDERIPAWEANGIARGPVSEAVRSVVQARMSVKEIGSGAAWTATHATGLSPSSLAVAGSDVIQMVRQKLPPMDKQVTRAGLVAYMTAIDAQIADIEAGETELGFITMADINRWHGQYDTRVQDLRQQLLRDGHDDAFAMSFDDITRRATPLADNFYLVVISMSNIRRALDDSFRDYRAHVARQEEQAASMGAISSFNQKKKLAEKIALGEKEKGHDDAPAETTAKVIAFPHKGKHCPPPKAVDDAKVLEKETAEKGKVALYITNDVTTVVGWETEATAKGLRLHDNFTVIHRFKKLIGADQGSMTYCIRIDGGDHGHPIIESGSPPSFDAYIRSEIAHYRKANDIGQLDVIASYLTGIGLDPRTYKLTPTG